MALRELVARVKFIIDNAKLQELNKNLDTAKAGAQRLKTDAERGVRVKADSSALVRLAQEARKAKAAVSAPVEMPKLTGFVASAKQASDGVRSLFQRSGSAFNTARKQADEIRRSMVRMRLADPTNPKLKTLQAQLNGVEREAREAAGALGRVGVAAKKATAAASGAGAGAGGMGKLAGAIGGVFAATQIYSWVRGTLDAADATGKLAAQLGLATDEMQALESFTTMAGASTEDLRGTLGALTRNMTAAAKGGKTQKEAFEALGIETDKWATEGLPSLWEALVTTGGALGELEDESKRLMLAQQLMGETGVKLLPGFKDGAASAREQMAALKDLAAVYSDDFIKNAEAANDEMHIFGKQLQGLGSQILVWAVPHLRSFMREVTPIAQKIGELTKNSNLLSGVLVTLAGNGIAKLISRFGGLRGAMLMALRVLWRFALPIALFDDLKTFIEGGNSALGQFLDDTFGLGAADAVLEGMLALWDDLSGSIQVAWGHLKGDQEAIDEGKRKLENYQTWLDGFAADVDHKFTDVLGESVWEWVKKNKAAYDQAGKDQNEAVAQWAKAFIEWAPAAWAVMAKFDEDYRAGLKGNQDALAEFGSDLSDNARKFRNWIQDLDRAWAPYERDFGSGLKRWGNGIDDFFSGVWESAIGGLNDLLEKLTGIPMLADLFGVTKDKPKEKPQPKAPAAPPPPGSPGAAVYDTLDRYARGAQVVGTSPEARTSTVSNSRSFVYQDHSQVTTNVSGVDGRNVEGALRRGETAHIELKRGTVQKLRQTIGAQ